MGDENQFRADLKHLARQDFKRSALVDEFSDSRNIDDKITEHKVYSRADKLREKVKEHHERNLPRYKERAFKKLMEDFPLTPKQGLADGPKPPFGAASKEHIHRQKMLERAERMARLPMLRRMDRIDRAEHNMAQALKQNRQQALSQKQ